MWADLIQELIGTYEELIDHNGDDMIDSRGSRIAALRAIEAALRQPADAGEVKARRKALCCSVCAASRIPHLETTMQTDDTLRARGQCTVPPAGWWCSREPGHDGPCAARPLAGAESETSRLQRDLDITNADHIALWLEDNLPDASLAYLACRIIEAHEAALRQPADAGKVVVGDDVERVAAAIEAVQGGLNYDYKDFCRDAARAAIEAMMEPTEEMKTAGYEMIEGRYGHSFTPTYIYRAMLSAALKDD